MFVNILETYGVVPQSIYPESYTSSSSRGLNTLLKKKLREHALILRKLSSSLKTSELSQEQQLLTLRAKKEDLMREIYIIMSATLGKVPSPDEPFVWEYYDANGKVRVERLSRDRTISRRCLSRSAVGKETLKSSSRHSSARSTVYVLHETCCFPSYLEVKPLDAFSLINDPRNDYSKLYTVDKLGNLIGGRPVLCRLSLFSPRIRALTFIDVNTEIKNMKDAVIKV